MKRRATSSFRLSIPAIFLFLFPSFFLSLCPCGASVAEVE